MKRSSHEPIKCKGISVNRVYDFIIHLFYSSHKLSYMSHEKNASLLAALHTCADACNHCTTACLSEKDVTIMAGCIRLDIDCAAICSLTASFIARGSVHGVHLLKECAEICTACATECENHAEKMDHCRECAEACRACAAVCLAAA